MNDMNATTIAATSTEPGSRIDTVAIPALRAEELRDLSAAARADLDRMISDFLIACPADEVERRDRFVAAAGRVALTLETVADTFGDDGQ